MSIKLTPDMVNASLNVGAPSITSKDLGRRNNPVVGMSMVLPISEIDFFGRNPRRIHDPEEFDRLKESIREIGVQQPVHVTTPPGSSRYMLAKGGNSRLLCLKQLLDETGNERYAKIPCIYVEYSSEEDILIAHLIENEQRAEMIFWDKACAYAEMRDVFQESSEKEVGARPLAKQFESKGLTVHYTKLSIYLYAADHLAALGHLCNKLSIQKATDLRSLSNSLQTSFKDACKDKDDTAFQEFWDQALENWANANADAEDLDVPALQKSLRHAFADTFEIEPDPHAGAVPPSGRLNNAPTSKAGADNAKSSHQSEASHHSPTLLDDERGDNSSTPGVQSDSVSRPPVDPADGADIRATGDAKDSSDSDNKSETQNEAAAPRTREQILADIQDAARRLLACVRIDSLLIDEPKMPYGYMLDFPDSNKPGWKSDGKQNHHALINVRHDLAATVFIYLWTVSGQKSLWDAPQLLSRYNPFTANQQTVICNVYPDANLRADAENIGIGLYLYSESVTEVMFELVMKDENARRAYFDHIHFCAELEQMEADNWNLYQEQL